MRTYKMDALPNADSPQVEKRHIMYTMMDDVPMMLSLPSPDSRQAGPIDTERETSDEFRFRCPAISLETTDLQITPLTTLALILFSRQERKLRLEEEVLSEQGKISL